MIEDIRTVLNRSGPSIWRDLVGCASLVLSFFALLQLPALI